MKLHASPGPGVDQRNERASSRRRGIDRVKSRKKVTCSDAKLRGRPGCAAGGSPDRHALLGRMLRLPPGAWVPLPSEGRHHPRRPSSREDARGLSAASWGPRRAMGGWGSGTSSAPPLPTPLRGGRLPRCHTTRAGSILTGSSLRRVVSVIHLPEASIPYGTAPVQNAKPIMSIPPLISPITPSSLTMMGKSSLPMKPTLA